MYYTVKGGGEYDWEVKDFINKKGWDVEKMQNLISLEMVEHITIDITPTVAQGVCDFPVWMQSSDG